MAIRNRRSSKTPTPQPTGDVELTSIAGLREFSGLVDDFAAAVNEELREAGQSERQAVGQAFRDTLAVQTGSIVELFQKIVLGLPADGQANVELFWRSSGAAVAITAARSAIQNNALGRRSVLEWIKLILEALKKILRQVLQFIKTHFPLSGLDLYLSIIVDLLPILNNLLDLLNKLLAGREPVDMARLSREMWHGLEAFWRAEAAAMRLGSVEADRSGDALGRGGAII